MSFFRSGNSQADIPNYTGMQLQTSSAAVPVTIAFGVNLVAPNIIWAGGFYREATSSGGKGGSTVTGYNYYSATMFAISEGPISGIGATIKNNAVSALAHGSLFNGATPQTPWSYLTENYPSQALNYNGLAFWGDPNVSLGSSATPPSIQFETVALQAKTGCNGCDADPALVIQEFLTNSEWGIGFPSASLDLTHLLAQEDGDASYQSYCNAAGLAISPVLSSQESASSILDRWLKITNSAAVWSEGLLKIIPYGDSPLTGSIISYGDNLPYTFSTDTDTNQSSGQANGYTTVGTKSFTPNTTLIYALTDDDFVSGKDASSKGGPVSDDPVTVQRTDPYSTPNFYAIEISQRGNFYDATPITAFDQNAIELYGLRVDGTTTAHEICDEKVAQVSIELIKGRGLYIRKTYSFVLSWEYCLLEPMDLVSLTQSVGNLLAGEVVRITSITEDENGFLTVTAEEFPAGVATAAEYPVQVKASTLPAVGGDPGSINAPLIFEPPGQLSQALQVWIAASGQNSAMWGGCNVWASWDGTNYSNVGQITSAARMGVLSAALASVSTTPAGPTIDTTNTLSVDLTESAGALLSGSVSDATNGATLCYVDGEYLAYETATLAGTDKYNLTYLVRGLYGSQASVGAHASGAPFARLDGAIFKYTYFNDQIGQTIHLKFTSFNLWGGNEESLADVTDYTHTLSGSPTPAAITIQSAAMTQKGLTETLSAAWQSDPLAETYEADISSNGGSTWTPAYNGPATALSMAGLPANNLLLRVCGISENGVKGPYGQVGITAPPIDYAPSYNGYSISYDDLATPVVNAISINYLQDWDDQNTSTIGQLLEQASTNWSISASLNLANASIYQNAQAIIAANGSIASLETTVTSNYSSLSASITTESEARVSGDNTNAAAISALSSTVTEVQAISTAGTANGYFTATAQSGVGTGVAAAVGLSVSAEGAGGTPATASLIVQAMSDGTSQVIVNASNFYVLNSSTKNVVFGTNSDGSLILNNVTKVNNVIESVNTTADGTQPILEIDFVNGAINFYA